VKRYYVWLVLVVSALTIVLVPLLSDLVRDVLLVELLRFAWLVERRVDSLPQEPFWIAFLFVALLVGTLIMLPRPHGPDSSPGEPRHHEGQVADLALLIRRAGRRPYFRRRLVQRLSQLGREVFGHRHGLDLPELRRGRRPVEQGPFPTGRAALPAGDRVHGDSQADLPHSHPSFQQALAHLRAEPTMLGRVPDPAVEFFVQFLEEQLEVDHAPFDRSRR